MSPSAIAPFLHSANRRHRVLQLLALLILLVPIAALAIWGVLNERPLSPTLSFHVSDQNKYLSVFESQSTKNVSFIDLTREKYYSRFLRRNAIAGFTDGQLWYIEKTSKDEYELCLVELPSLQIVTSRKLETDSIRELTGVACVVDGCLINVRIAEPDSIELSDLRTGSQLDAIDIGKLVKVLLNFGNSSIMVTQFSELNPLVRDYTIIHVVEGRLRIGAKWKALMWNGWPDGSSPYIASLTPDGLTTEIRDSHSDEVIQSISIPSALAIPPPLASFTGAVGFGKSWISWNTTPTQFIDPFFGRKLPVPIGFKPIERDLQRKRMIVSDGSELVVIDETTAQELVRFKSPGFIHGTTLFSDDNQLAVATSDTRVFVYDLSTGKLLRCIDPFRWTQWVNVLAAIVFAAWCTAWLRIAARTHSQGWIDQALCSGLVIGYIAFRSSYGGMSSDPTRPIYQVAEGVMASWVIVAIAWLMFGMTRWSLRVLPILLLFGVSTGIAASIVGFRNPRIGEFVVGMSVLIATICLIFLPLRIYGLRFQLLSRMDGAESTIGEDSKSYRGIPLRDFFLATAVLAVGFAIFRGISLAVRIDLYGVLELISLGLSVSILGCVALWTALSFRSAGVRWIVWSAMIAIAGILTVITSFAVTGWKWIPAWNLHIIGFAMRLFVSASIATLLGFYAYRLRGWRIVSTEEISGKK